MDGRPRNMFSSRRSLRSPVLQQITRDGSYGAASPSRPGIVFVILRPVELNSSYVLPPLLQLLSTTH